MCWRRLIWGLLSTAVAFASEHMSVAVCNIGDIPAWVIKNAKTEAAYLFGAIDVAINWTSCGAEVAAEDADLRPDFIVRVRTGGHINRAGPASLDLMGRAFVDPVGAGFLVDVYFGAIQELALRYSVADADQVLGCTMAHELGHLLIGPGHRTVGIMRATWTKKQLDALRQRSLKFGEGERDLILRKLRSRAADSFVTHPIFDTGSNTLCIEKHTRDWRPGRVTSQ